MADYEKLYHDLFNSISKVIEELKDIQQKAEEHYIETCESKKSIRLK